MFSANFIFLHQCDTFPEVSILNCIAMNETGTNLQRFNLVTKLPFLCFKKNGDKTTFGMLMRKERRRAGTMKAAR